jgi:hypothetical protein
VKRRVRDLQRRDVRVLRYQPYAAASAGPPAFLPSSLSGLQLWLDGADEATKTLNGSNVSAWLDKSGNNRNATQGAAATQPLNVSGGAPVAGVDFVDGTNVLALASALSFGTAATIVVVVTANAAANAYVYADAGSADGIISGFAVGGDLEWFNSSGGTDRQKYIDNPVAGSRYRLVTTQADGVSLVGRMNGAQVFSVVPAIALTSIQFIGAASAGPVSGFSGKIHELIVYNRVLTADEITQLEAYLARWA